MTPFTYTRAGDVPEAVRRVGRHVDRGRSPDRTRFTPKGDFQLAFEKREHLFEVVPVRSWSTAVEHTHVDQAVASGGLRASDQDGVDVARQRDVLDLGAI